MKGIKCKRCHGDNIEFIMSWTFKSCKSGIKNYFELWFCNDCRKTFRVTEKVSER